MNPQTEPLFHLFHSFLTHYGCHFSTLWSRFTYGSENFLSFFLMYRIVVWITLNPGPTALQLMPEWSLFNTRIFLHKAHHSFLALMSIKHHPSTMLRVVLFIFSFIFISWRLITSQHFSGFCHTVTWISPQDRFKQWNIFNRERKNEKPRQVIDCEYDTYLHF